MSTGGFIHCKDPLCLIKGHFFVHRVKAYKEGDMCKLVGSIIQPTRTGNDRNEKICHQAKCTSIFYIYPKNIPGAVFQASGSIHGVHPSAKAVPADHIIDLLGTYIDTIKVEALLMKG